jgi:hypothetical protein
MRFQSESIIEFQVVTKKTGGQMGEIGDLIFQWVMSKDITH